MTLLSDLNRLSVYEASQLIRSGEITPEELVADCLERIQEVDSEVLAWRLVDGDRAMEAAKSLAKEAKNGQLRSPLHGIPIGIKDSFDVAGLPTRAGSEIFEDAEPAVRDSSIVAQLREAGAIILGKTHTTKFAFYDPAPTRNPYHLNHTPGGSSSGSAAAVSSDMALLTVGSQTNASICRPGAYSGAVGFKPTTNSMKMEGVFPLAPTFDSPGFFGRNLLDIAAGYLPFSAGSFNEYVRLLPMSLKKGSCRVGVISDPIYLEASVELHKVQEETIKRLEANHYNIKEVRPSCSFADIIECHQTVMAYEAAQHYATLVEEHDIGGKFRSLVEEGNQIREKMYKHALDHINSAKDQMREVFDTFDVLMALPTDTSAPKGLDSTGNPRFTTPWTALGVPLVVIPAALDNEGLPLAMMFASAPGTDITLIKNCLLLERVIGSLPKPIIENHE